MFGIPEDWVNQATLDGLRVLEKVMEDSIKDNVDLTGYGVADGIGKAFGAKK